MDTKNAKKTRREERGARTKKRLLEATIDCLADRGYAKMSTNDVVRKAGTSRGALTHHFPSKSHLVAEAAAYLIDKRIRYTIRKIEALGEDGNDLRKQIETKWKAYEKWFPANIEFMVASRTDTQLQAHFSRVMKERTRELMDLQEKAFSQDMLNSYMTGCFIRGLCLESLVNPPELVDQIFDSFVQLMTAADMGQPERNPGSTTT